MKKFLILFLVVFSLSACDDKHPSVRDLKSNFVHIECTSVNAYSKYSDFNDGDGFRLLRDQIFIRYIDIETAKPTLIYNDTCVFTLEQGHPNAS